MKSKIVRTIVFGYSLLTTLVLIFLLFSFKNLKQSFDEITVKRINIVDEQGHNRIVIANQEHFPQPVLNGKEIKRRVNPAGMIFYDEKNNECGGLIFAKDDQSRLRAFTFDYSHAEGLALYSKNDTAGNNFKAGIIINDNYTGKKYQFNGNQPNRILSNTDNGNAGLTINDALGNPRITIKVDSTGNPSIDILNKQGKLVKHLTDINN